MPVLLVLLLLGAASDAVAPYRADGTERLAWAVPYANPEREIVPSTQRMGIRHYESHAFRTPDDPETVHAFYLERMRALGIPLRLREESDAPDGETRFGASYAATEGETRSLVVHTRAREAWTDVDVRFGEDRAVPGYPVAFAWSEAGHDAQAGQTLYADHASLERLGDAGEIVQIWVRIELRGGRMPGLAPSLLRVDCARGRYSQVDPADPAGSVHWHPARVAGQPPTIWGALVDELCR